MLKKFWMFVLCLCLAVPAFAQIEEVTPSKYGAIVVEADSGKILYEDGADRTLHPASLTKMMTLYMTFAAMRAGRLDENSQLPVSPYAAAASPTKLGLREGQTIRTKDAILGLVTKSANDAARVLAEKIGGSEARFAELMTSQAKRLGMTKTRFRNASGLPDKRQVSSPKDMAILARAILVHFPEYYGYFNTRQFTFRGVTHNNHNHLMERYPGMDGFKTGYVNASGFNLVASAVQNKTRLIGVVFGGKSAALRDNWMEKLLNRSFVEAGAINEHSGTRYAGTVLQPKIASLEEPDNTVDRPAVVGDMNVAEDEKMDKPAKLATTKSPVSKKIANKPAKAAKLASASWAVQIGAYKSKRDAQRAAAHARKNYRDLKHSTQLVSAVSTKSGKFYQARLIGLTEARATNACTALKNKGRDCVTLRGAG